MIIILKNYYKKRINYLNVDFKEKYCYIDNKEQDLTSIFENSKLNIEYIFKNRNSYINYEFFIFELNNVEAIEFLEIFFNNFERSCNINWKNIFFDLKNNKLDFKSINKYINTKKKNRYNLILNKIDDGFIKLGYYEENLKLKKQYLLIKNIYDENLSIDSIFNNLRYIPQDLGINIKHLKGTKTEYSWRPSILFEEKESNNIQYDFKNYLCKDFFIKTKDERFDLFLELKYQDLENINMMFYFDKTKKGLVDTVLYNLDNFIYSNVNWRKLYDEYYDKKYAEKIIKDGIVNSYINTFLFFKRYDLLCKVYDDKKNIYFKIEMKEKTKPDKYSI